MRKLWFSFLLLFAVLLSACSAASSPTTAAATKTGGQSQSLPTEDSKAVKMECKVVGSVVATPDPTAIARFPASLPGDWTRGNPNAALKIIEYSDYM